MRIEWDSVEGHEQGFRESPGFRGFFASVRPFFGNIEEMSHYEAAPIRRVRQPNTGQGAL